jgi:hypothetical protein
MYNVEKILAEAAQALGPAADSPVIKAIQDGARKRLKQWLEANPDPTQTQVNDVVLMYLVGFTDGAAAIASGAGMNVSNVGDVPFGGSYRKSGGWRKFLPRF